MRELSAASQQRSLLTAAASAVIREPGALSSAAAALSREASAVPRERSRALLPAQSLLSVVGIVPAPNVCTATVFSIIGSCRCRCAS
jgi:hypothetical protein